MLCIYILVVLTDEEREYLKTLGNKDYLIDSKERRIALLSLVDILYAYAYNHRTTLGESTVESAWTINKLSSTLSWLQVVSYLQFFTDVVFDHFIFCII